MGLHSVIRVAPVLYVWIGPKAEQSTKVEQSTLRSMLRGALTPISLLSDFASRTLSVLLMRMTTWTFKSVFYFVAFLGAVSCIPLAYNICATDPGDQELVDVCTESSDDEEVEAVSREQQSTFRRSMAEAFPEKTLYHFSAIS